MELKKLVAVLAVALTLFTLLLASADARNERPRIVHPLTGMSPDTTYVVTKLTDSGDNTNAAPGTFRRALVDANNHPGFDLIVFDFPGSGVKTITLANYLPILTDDAGVMIDGTQSDDRIEINFVNAKSHFGLHFMSNNNVVKGLTLNNLIDAAAIALEDADNNVLIGNFIGTDPGGTLSRPNHTAIMLQNADNNRIGGTTGVTPGGACTGDCNLLSGNFFHGIVLNEQSRNNRILGNYIGVNKNGNAILENREDGVLIADGINTVVGGPTPQERNVITGNRVIGVEVALLNSFGNLVQGNYIGLNSAGTAVLPVEGSGVFVGLSTHNNVVDGNVIAGHRHFGILIFDNAVDNEIKNNRIGISPFDDSNFGNRMKGIEVQGYNNYIHHNRIANNNSDGIRIKVGMNNRISQNSIFNNRTFGINLDTDAFSPNDSGDGDTGSNGLQNFPTINAAELDGSKLTLKGFLNSKPNAPYTLEFFQNPACDLAFNNPVGEGKVYLGTANVNTDGAGNGSFVVNLTNTPTTGVVTATATDNQNNTSEFSYCTPIIPVAGKPPKPELLAPTNGEPTSQNPPFLDWTASPGAVRYVVKIVEGSKSGPQVHKNGQVSQDQYMPPPLPGGKTYFWFAKACNANKKCSKSGWYSFTIE